MRQENSKPHREREVDQCKDKRKTEIIKVDRHRNRQTNYKTVNECFRIKQGETKPNTERDIDRPMCRCIDQQIEVRRQLYRRTDGQTDRSNPVILLFNFITGAAGQ